MSKAYLTPLPRTITKVITTEYINNIYIYYDIHMLCVYQSPGSHRNRLLNLEVDRPVANLAASAAQLFAGVSREQKASIEVLLESIRSSKMFPKFVEMQKDFNVRFFCALFLSLFF